MPAIARVRLIALASSVGVAAFVAAAVRAAPPTPAPTPLRTASPAPRVRGQLRKQPAATPIPAAIDAGSNDAGPITGLVYNGGRVIPNVKLVAVYWTANVNATLLASIESFYKDVVSGPYLEWLSEYNTVGLTDPKGVAGSNQGIGRGSFVGGYTIASPAKCSDASPCTVTEAEVLNELVTQIEAKAIPAPTAGCDGLPDTLYMFDFPPNVTVQSTDGSQSCVQWCGVHGAQDLTINGATQRVVYAFHGDSFTGACAQGCGNDPDPLNNSTATHAHEIIEAITDVDVELYNQGVSGVRVGWYSDNPAGEIADICEAPGTIACTSNCPGGGNTWTVNPGWSNVAAGCVTSMQTLPPACTGPNTPAGCRPCSCADDGVACSGSAPFCETNTNVCVQCTQDSQCPNGTCVQNICLTADDAGTDAGMSGGNDAGADAAQGSDAGQAADAAAARDASAAEDASSGGGGDSGAGAPGEDASSGNGGNGGNATQTTSSCAVARGSTDGPAIPSLAVLALVGAALARRRRR